MQTIVLVMSYIEFLKFDFNGLDLFVILMLIHILNQVYVIHTYISYCFIFEVSDLWVILALTTCAITADF